MKIPCAKRPGLVVMGAAIGARDLCFDKERTINNLNKLMSFLPSSSLFVDHITRYARSSRLEYNKKSY